MLSVIFGLAGIVIGALWLAAWGAWEPFLVVLQGSIPPFIILVGLIAVAAGISSMKDNMAAKKEEAELEEESGSEEPAAPQEESGPEDISGAQEPEEEKREE